MPQPGSVRHLIAEATRDTHAALDRHEEIGVLMSDTLSLPRYRQLMEAYALFYEAAEKQRERIGSWDELSLGQSVQALLEDLKAMDSNGIRETSHAVDFSWITSPLQSLSMLYVLHGAGFGGKMIARKVAVTLPEAPRSYLGLGIDGALWKTLVDRLEVYAGDEVKCGQLIRTAEQTFKAFGKWIFAYCSPTT